MKQSRNILMIQEVARALGDLRDQVVFIGGATTALYIDDKGAPTPTPSDDVDLVVEITSHQEYAKLEKVLRQKGFKDPLPDPDVQHPICRKMYNDIQVDIMPTDESILGFSNRWYSDAIKKKMQHRLPDGSTISVFNVTYFLATKFEAFTHRGKDSDIRFSQDLEDILAVLDGCSYIASELMSAEPKVRAFIVKEFEALLEDASLLEEAATGFIAAGGDSTKRAKKLVARVRGITSGRE